MTAAARRVVRVAAYAVCTDATNALLLCRIAPGFTDGHDGWWTLPGGGLDHGEDPRAGVIRELAEETGYVGEVVELLDVHSRHADITARDGERLDWHGIHILYRCRIVGGSLRDERAGSTDTCRWFAAGDLRDERLVDIAEIGARHIGVA